MSAEMTTNGANGQGLFTTMTVLGKTKTGAARQKIRASDVDELLRNDDLVLGAELQPSCTKTWTS